jgi:hypothetical protein
MSKGKGGRPSGYTATLGKTICDLVARRVPLVEIVEMSGMPCADTVYRWKRTIPEFSEMYARAREHRADARQDRIDEIARKLEAGDLDPNAARVLIDAEKWQMAKEKPRTYGDRIEATHTIDATATLTELRKLISDGRGGKLVGGNDVSKA